MSIKEKAAEKAKEVETMINDGKENIVKKSSVLKKVVIGAGIAGGAFGVWKIVDHFRGLRSNGNDDLDVELIDDDCEVEAEDDDVEDDNSDDEE